MEYKSLRCTKCNEKFDTGENKPMVLFCGHSVCKGCCEKINGNTDSETVDCRVCEVFGIRRKPVTTIPCPVNYLVTAFLEQINDKNKGICSECSISEDKMERFQTCKECTLLEFGCSIDEPSSFPEDFDFKKIVICADCAIKKHIKNGHFIADYLPIHVSVLFQREKQKLEKSRDIALGVFGHTDDKFVLLLLDDSISKLFKLLARAKDVARFNKILEAANQFFTEFTETKKFEECLKTLNTKMETFEREDCFSVLDAHVNGLRRMIDHLK